MKRTKIIIIAVAVTVVGLMAAAAFYYTTQLSLVLKGDKTVTIGLNGVYQEPGVTARLHGKDVSDKVKISGRVDSSRPGSYVLEYRAGSLKAHRTVKVLDEMNPRIILEEDKEKDSTLLGEEFTEPGYTAYDEKGRDITDRVKISGSNFKRAGKNTVSYTVRDDEGNITRVKREIQVEANTDYDTPGLPVCMYHYVYDENDPPDDLNARFGNYISMQDLEEELDWLNSQGYYYPTWREVRDYVDGKLLLPEKSIVLCFDDGAVSFLEKGIPVLERCKVPATCFMITSSNGEKKIQEHESDYVYYESHSHNMHRAGGNVGHGGIFTALSDEEALADLEKSIEICGSRDAFAYPYGDYTADCRDTVEKAGFLCGVTTEYGKARPGNDPYLLPRVRMVMGQSLDTFIDAVAPNI